MPLRSEVVRAWDVRDVSDQVHSMGAKWVAVDFKERQLSSGPADQPACGFAWRGSWFDLVGLAGSSLGCLRCAFVCGSTSRQGVFTPAQAPRA